MRPQRKRYFDLRQHGFGGQHARRLAGLSLGLLAGLALVTNAVRTQPQRVIFRPSAPVTATDRALAELPPPTVPPLAPVGGGAPIEDLHVVPTPAGSAQLYDDVRLTSEPDLTVPAMQALLDAQPGPLKSALIPVGDRNQSVAEVVVGQAYLYSLNPKLLLALLEIQQGLLSNPAPGPEQLEWAMKFQGEEEKWRGLYLQIRWAARELRRGVRDFPYATELVYSDDAVKSPLPPGLNPASYAVVRTLARTMTPEQLQSFLSDQRFVTTYAALFEDPRSPLGSLPAPAAPFLASPLPKITYVTSFFDHEFPFLTQNGSLVSWWGRRETDISYDGHDGWDYGLRPPDPILAAAAGTVVWAGNSDDGCGVPARGVVIDHGNGYRTLYWHLSEIQVSLGQTISQGERLGIVGSTGCAFGPHLHFQTQYLGRNTDPYGWCGAEADPWSQHPMGMASRWLWADRPNPCALPESAVAVTERSPGFTKTGAGWQTAPLGVSGESLWITSQTAPISASQALTQTISELAGVAEPIPTPAILTPPATATWRPKLPKAGRYRVLAYIPYFYNGHEDATSVRYIIHHAGGADQTVVSHLVSANDWADLGTFEFDPATDPRVELSNETLEADQGVWAGAIVWLPE